MSDDEYARFDFSEFTEDELREIDTDIARKTSGGPQITIELQGEPFVPSSTPTSNTAGLLPHALDGFKATPSPFEEYRYGVLSVTDLASLAWCEVQFDYGLRQRRSRPITTRPESFISAQGKEICVEKAVAERNDAITKQGRAIHKHLELEVRAEQLPVDISSDEEHWALRLLNMLASLRCILLEGYTREMPVFGVLQGVVMVGIIDEVVRRPRQPATQKRTSGSPPESLRVKKSRPSCPDPLQPFSELLPGSSMEQTINIDGTSAADVMPAPFLEESSTPMPTPGILHVVDTKTRRSRTLPSHEDTLPSRIQLMLYYRLLRDLTRTSPPFDFLAFWRHLGVDPIAPFSTAFLVQLGLTEETGTWAMTCLNDLTTAWVKMIQALNICGIDTTLEIIYRHQEQDQRRGKAKGKVKSRGWQKSGSSINDVITEEDLDLARAIEASLLDVGVPETFNDFGVPLRKDTHEALESSSKVSELPKPEPRNESTTNENGTN
ncbi:hypothetical protein H0H81_010510 [Sphagnurus paluster]|uniref:Uncharacterized protein n=1 Tax=Sphagnurus paluster TaxID=117069 RepID=A0A9P7K477_9AGAR|nr:hypothetical protein H0H81_010510 [Sphagnurus paluster]